MLGKLMFLFVVVPLVELFLLIKIGMYIGAGYTILIVILTGIMGAILAKQQGLRVIRKIREDLAAGKIPAEELFDGLMILIAGALLITPGLITDAIGFSILLPFVRNKIKSAIKNRIKEKISEGSIRFQFFDRDGHWGEDE